MATDTATAAARPVERVLAGTDRRRHVLDLDDFTADEITAVLDDAAAMREVLGRDVKKVPTLRGRVIVTLFYEASTRTRISFEEAGKILSADVINMTATASSVEKGESLLNTGLTLQAMGVDAIVVRHPHSGAPNFLARSLSNVAIINAGDGAHAHPTQGLLDLYTAREHLGEIAGRKVVIVGDVLHSRVARSAVWGFAHLGAEVVLSGPPTLLPDPFTPGGWGAAADNGIHNPLANVRLQPDLDAAIEEADLVMALRLQTERQQRGFFPSIREYIRRWQVNDQRMAQANANALLMHPGPMNEGIEVSTALAHGERSLIEEQVTNGVAIRMALLYQLVGHGSGAD
ncbi:MAG: aspartate carbamoyltransferase catalytic subunit [Dehalococcoidia bacterium]|nr:aspartate carbamoyltransferase catalytic subunit [Dehalococcoidia bacterium]